MKSLVVSIAAGTLLALASSGPSWAQANTISILQQGRENTLTVDQTNATGSQVVGLSGVGRSDSLEQLTLDNVEVSPAESGETFPREVEAISNVSGSGGIGANPDAAATQQGAGNFADVRISGTGGTVGLQQGGLSASGNSATVALDGSGTALIGQIGSNNRSTLDVSGDLAFGSILQQGDSNVAALTVTGGGQGALTQIGNGNDTALNVDGITGTNVSYTLVGSGVTNLNPTQGVDVITNAASVTITQTSFLP